MSRMTLRNIKTTVRVKRQTLRNIGEPMIIKGTRVNESRRRELIFFFGADEKTNRRKTTKNELWKKEKSNIREKYSDGPLGL